MKLARRTSKADYDPDAHMEEVAVRFSDGTIIEVPEDNPHTCIYPEGVDRRCLACEAQWITAPDAPPEPTATCDRCGKPATDCIGGTHYHCDDPECIRVVTIEELVASDRIGHQRGQALLASGLAWDSQAPDVDDCPSIELPEGNRPIIITAIPKPGLAVYPHGHHPGGRQLDSPLADLGINVVGRTPPEPGRHEITVAIDEASHLSWAAVLSILSAWGIRYDLRLAAGGRIQDIDGRHSYFTSAIDGTHPQLVVTHQGRTTPIEVARIRRVTIR